jgi:hypothetical protein
MKSAIKILVIASALLVSACSTSPKTQVVQMGDNQFSKSQIMAQLAKLDQTELEIKSKKGATPTNVAAFLFWTPGLVYTYYDSSEALKLVEQRRSHLTRIYNHKFLNDERQHAHKATPSKTHTKA